MITTTEYGKWTCAYKSLWLCHCLWVNPLHTEEGRKWTTTTECFRSMYEAPFSNLILISTSITMTMYSSNSRIMDFRKFSVILEFHDSNPFRQSLSFNSYMQRYEELNKVGEGMPSIAGNID